MEIKKGNWYVCTEGVSLEGQNVTYKKGGLSEHEAIKEVEQLVKKCIQEVYHPKF